MEWIAWSLLVASAVLAAATHLVRRGDKLPPAHLTLTVGSLILAAAAAVLAMSARAAGETGGIPLVLLVIGTVCFAVSSGSPYTELIFHLAANHAGNDPAEPSAESPLRGGLWIGLLERAAITSTLWAAWPEGIAIVLAIKGLGRFSELKNHNAAEQFILGTFSSSLCAAAAYGIGQLLLAG